MLHLCDASVAQILAQAMKDVRQEGESSMLDPEDFKQLDGEDDGNGSCAVSSLWYLVVVTVVLTHPRGVSDAPYRCVRAVDLMDAHGGDDEMVLPPAPPDLQSRYSFMLREKSRNTGKLNAVRVCVLLVTLSQLRM
jgi:hypothetical protein